MWFSVYDYPKFINSCNSLDYDIMLSWEETFKLMGFSTYKLNSYGGIVSDRHYLDEEEFTVFVLRFG